MAELIGLVASVTALVSHALQVSQSLSRIAASAREHQSLEKETLELSLALVKVQNSLLENGHYGGNAHEFEAVIRDCSKLLRDVDSRCAHQNRNTFLRRLNWARSSSSVPKVKDLAQRLTEVHKSILRLLLSVSISPDSRLQHDDSLAPITHHKVNLDRRWEVIQWLSYIDPADRHHELQNERVSGAHDHCLTSTQFTEWFSGPSYTTAEALDDSDSVSEDGSWVVPLRLLWLVGRAGSGKTFVTSTIIDHIRSQIREQEAIAFCYFDYRFQQDFTYILGSLLRQLCMAKNRIPDSVQKLFDSVAETDGDNDEELPSLFSSPSSSQLHPVVSNVSMDHPKSAMKTATDKGERREQRPPLSEFIKVLQSVCLEFERCFIIIDAIDEHDSFGKKSMLQFLEGLRSCSCQVLLTSRENADQISAVFAPSYTSLRVSPRKEYVEKYIFDCLDKSTTLSTTDEQKAKIKDNILEKSVDKNNIYNFLLAKLRVEWILEQFASNSAIEQSLQTLPYRFPVAFSDEASDDIDFSMASSTDDERHSASVVLLWILHAKRPLSVLELRHACAAFDPQVDGQTKTIPAFEMLERACSGYLAVDEATSTVSLVHYSVFEYYRDRRARLYPQGHREVTLACLRYIKTDVLNSEHWDPEALDIDSHDYPFLDYAMNTWSSHCMDRFRKDDDYLRCLTDQEQTSYLEKRDSLADEILQLTQELLCRPDKRFLRLEALFESSDTDNVISRPRFNNELLPPCHLAAKLGLLKEVESLIKLDDTSLTQISPCGATALHYAAFAGHFEIVQKLLSYQNDKTKEAKISMDQNGMAPLHCAAYQGHHAIMHVLLGDTDDNLANLSHETIGTTPLMIAASVGRVNSMRLLLKAGADVHLKNSSGQTALHLAASWGSEAAVKLLLKCGAEVNVRDSKQRIPIHYASMRSKYAVVELLLSQGSELDARAYNNDSPVDCDETPLSLAIRNNNLDMTELLLLKGADVSSPRIEGQSLTSFARGMDMKAISERLELYSTLNDSTRRRARKLSLRKPGSDSTKSIQETEKAVSGNVLVGQSGPP